MPLRSPFFAPYVCAKKWAHLSTVKYLVTGKWYQKEVEYMMVDPARRGIFSGGGRGAGIC